MKTLNTKNTKRHRLSALASLLYVLSVGHPVLADDTEVLIGPGGQAWATPNVLFIMDTSGSMAWGVDRDYVAPPPGEPTRLKIVQDVFRDLINTNSGFNVALMRFDRWSRGGYFVTPMQELNTTTRSSIIAAADAFRASGGTPLSETFYEAARFWGGMSVDYGSRYNHPGVQNGRRYISPINSQCQRNYAILLTDGVPSRDSDADYKVSRDFLGGRSCDGRFTWSGGRCLDDIAGYLHNDDQNRNIAGTQTVDTYTIGFTTNQTLLENAARKGGGSYITANNADQLSAAFTEILSVITDTNDSFAPPALAANTFNGISHSNKLYFALFEPAAAPKWNGNVKPYELDSNHQLVDADGNLAVDDRGIFLNTSRSFWSTRTDGSSIAAGGANGQLPGADSRNLYTYTGTYDIAGLVPDSPAISADSNALKNITSSELSADMLGITGSSATVIDAEFIRVLDTVRSTTLGAPLHSQPALVTYGGTETSPDLTLFVATNDGFLHALNANTGAEEFSFIPKELLSNLPTLTRGTGAHPYGLDGDISVWRKENSADTDHTIESADGDHVFVYVGMRRGGRNYYALDVTDRNAPTLKWVIRGGPGGTTGFEELGQSWSKPTLTSIKVGNDARKVLIFGGGYDSAQDANPLDTDDNIGRAIFIVDADSGERLWWAGPTGSSANLEFSELTNSIPSEIRLLDSNLDGSTDRLYVGDMRGQVFRFDLDATLTSSTGGLLANLGGNTEADNRRFFYPPDVVVTQRPGSASYISINIGSGYRAHPLNPLNTNGSPAPRVNDRFYSLRDPNVTGAVPSSFNTITTGNLFDATNSLITNSSDISSLAAANGWYLTLGNGNGEKVLAPSITINGEILFTTYVPPVAVASANCAPPPGTGRLYRVSLFDASPSTNTTTITTDDRAETLNRPGIPPAPTAMFREDASGNVVIVTCQGTECEALPNAIQIQETYWRSE